MLIRPALLSLRVLSRSSVGEALRTLTLAVVTAMVTMAALRPGVAVAVPSDSDTAGFGAPNGYVVGPAIIADDVSAGSVLQPDGKIIIAGTCLGAINNDFCLVRYTAAGLIDTTFGTGGRVVTPIGIDNDTATAVALQRDGKIVVAGWCSSVGSRNFCLARFTASGALDPTFNGTGIVFTLTPGDDRRAYAVLVQHDGRIVAAGTCYGGGNLDFCLSRYNADGSLDTTFNATGRVSTPIGGADAVGTAITQQADGRLVVGGYCGVLDIDFCVARYNVDGTLDASFNGTGSALTSFGTTLDYVTSIALQPDGRILLAGRCASGLAGDVCLVRYTPSGSLDTTFNATGKLVSSIGTARNDRVNGMVLQPDGRIIVGGYCDRGFFEFCAARYHPDGTLDTSFSSGGSGVAGPGAMIRPVAARDDEATGVLLQADGKIVLTGHCYRVGASMYDFCAMRLVGGPQSYQNCKPDLDGDGVVLATTDALINMRVALGLTGDAVIGGITFPANATRKTWPLIRDYLVTQCGLSIAP